MVNVEELKNEAKRILDQGIVKYIIGYQKGTHGMLAAPLFIKNAKEINKLIWSPTCVHNLARFLTDEKRRVKGNDPDKRPIGIIAKGCDSRALVVLLQEEYIKRENIYVIGLSCEQSGIVDEKKLAKKVNGAEVKSVEFGENDKIVVTTHKKKFEVPAEEVIAQRCLECKSKYPVIQDVLFGEKKDHKLDNYFKSVEKIESLSVKERYNFWKEQFDKCIRCYACRSVCPMCYCEECVVDTINFAVTADTSAEEKAQKIKWVEKSPVTSENFVYHMVRAIHLAGRCIDCGECERVCPLDIPIRFLNKKLEKEAKELFDYDVGFNPDQPSLISSFNEKDPEDFIR
jgi:ferredoxin